MQEICYILQRLGAQTSPTYNTNSYVGLRERIEKHYSQTKVSVRRNTNETQIKPRVEYYINPLPHIICNHKQR